MVLPARGGGRKGEHDPPTFPQLVFIFCNVSTLYPLLKSPPIATLTSDTRLGVEPSTPGAANFE